MGKVRCLLEGIDDCGDGIGVFVGLKLLPFERLAALEIQKRVLKPPVDVSSLWHWICEQGLVEANVTERWQGIPINFL